MAPGFTNNPPFVSHLLTVHAWRGFHSHLEIDLSWNLVFKQDGAMDGPPKSIDQLIEEYGSISKRAYQVYT